MAAWDAKSAVGVGSAGNSRSSRSTESSSAILHIDRIAFAYEGKEVLREASLEVRSGSCTCLVGVNGCGKSTLLDCVLGVNRISGGSIELNGIPASTLKPAALARLLSYVPQLHERSFPYPVEHIVLMGRSVWSAGLGAPDPSDRELAREALAACGIAHLAEQPYTTLSGGEMQMVLLARALAQQTPLILMDEPTAHLDFYNELLFLETVERLTSQRGVAVLMATHALNQAFHLANAGVPTRVALMHEGRILHEGPPRLVLTTKVLRSVFGIEAVALERLGGDIQGPSAGDGDLGRPVRQLVPLRTMHNAQCTMHNEEVTEDNSQCTMQGHRQEWNR